MDSITLINDTLFAKLGELTMNHKYIAESNGCCWSNVVIWLIICAVIIWLAYIVKGFLKERTTSEKKKNESEEAEQKQLKIDSKQEEIKAIYRSKALDFMEKEMSSCQKIYADLRTFIDENEKLTKQIDQFLVKAEKSIIVTKTDIDELQAIVSKLEKDLSAIDLTSLKESVDGLSDKMKDEQDYFANNAYLKVLSGFMNKKCDISEILNPTPSTE